MCHRARPPTRCLPLHLDPPLPPAPRAAPWHRDPIAWTLVGGGAVVGGLGAFLLVDARSLRRDAAAEPRDDVRAALRDKADARRTWGTVATVAGVAVLTAGDREAGDHARRAAVAGGAPARADQHRDRRVVLSGPEEEQDARAAESSPRRPTAPPLQPGDLVGSYRITRQIGAGGMGAVYEAQHVHLDTRAAIKVLLPELSANPEAIKRFVNEARAASALKHPRIVTVHECAQRPNGQWFIVLEFVEGGSLKRKMQSVGGALGIGEVVAIIAQTASALDAAHRARIIHRDIKPDNILLSQSADRDRRRGDGGRLRHRQDR
jgi:hypothetical protein